MNPQQESYFKRYEHLKGIVKEAEAELKKLQPFILPLVPEDKEFVTEKGYFYIQKRATWKFSDEVEAEEEKLEQMKAGEKAKGIAEAMYTDTLVYRTGRPEIREKVE